MRKIFTLPFMLLSALTGLVGCGSDPDVGPLKARRAAVLVDGCAIDEWQRATLAAAETTRVLDEVVLRCLSLREDGTISPSDATSRANLRNLTRDLQALGYQVSLAVVSAGDDGVDYSSQKLLSILQNPSLRATANADLASIASSVNFLDLALQPLPDSGRAAFTQWVTELATMVRPVARLGVFAPPATVSESVPGQFAIDVSGLASSLDRVRYMTLDFSCCDGGSGPTTDPAWIGEVADYGASRTVGSSASIDIALPLYGIDFSSVGQHQISYLEAVGLAQNNGQQIQRNADGGLSFEYTAPNGTVHQVFFDDATALMRYQSLFDSEVDAKVGILYYGLGYEDPALFTGLAQRR